MKCPNDGTTLAMSSRDGVEIDYCPGCRGVWLDRGELDKIIERAATQLAPVAPQPASAPAPAPPDRPYRDERGRYDDRDRRDDPRYGSGHKYDQHKKRKKRSFLEDLFEFD